METMAYLMRNFLVHILVAAFGVSSWIAINGLWVESPLLVQRLPEGWTLASDIIFITQIANIGPLFYSLIKRRFQISIKRVERYAIHIIFTIGFLACLGLTFCWDRRVYFFGKERGVPFLLLTLLLALVDCTTSLLYFPYISYFKPKYVLTLLVGESLSGFIPSTVSLIQGIGGNPVCQNETSSTLNGTNLVAVYPPPNFGVETFFIFLSVVMVISWLAFYFLDQLPIANHERIDGISEIIGHDQPSDDAFGKEQSMRSQMKYPPSIRGRSSTSGETNSNDLPSFSTSNGDLEHPNKLPIRIFRGKIFFLLCMEASIAFLANGFVPSIQSYACLPYGNLTYHLSNNLSVLVHTMACLMACFLEQRVQKKFLNPTFICGSIAALYIIIVATQSPTPPLKDSVFGSILMIGAWLVYAGSLSFSKAVIASVLRSTSLSHDVLFYFGAFTQLGSFIGATIIFVIVNYTETFVAYYPCT